jgi:hypothetical protein
LLLCCYSVVTFSRFDTCWGGFEVSCGITYAVPRVAGERYLFARREGADFVATSGLFLRQDEGGLGVVHLQGYLLKCLSGQAGAAANDGELVARVFLFGEDVHM